MNPSPSHHASRDSDRTRSQMLSAAFDLFVERGFDAVSIREIAQASGVTKSLIHHHFGGKEGLWDEVKAQAFEPFYEQQRAELAAAEAPGAELLLQGVVNYFQFLRSNPKVARLFAWAHLEGDTSCSDMDADLVGLGSARVAEAQKRGALRDDINPTHVVTIFINLFSQWFQAREHHRDWPGIGSDEEFLDDFLKVFLEGLLPRPSSS